MKLVFELKNIKEIYTIAKLTNVKCIEVGFQNLSLVSAHCFTTTELLEIIKCAHKYNLGVILNSERLFKNDEYKYFDDILDILNEFDFISYSDFGVKVYLEELNYHNKLIYRAPTYLTNTSDCNLYGSLNDYIVISPEIQTSELIQINNNLLKKEMVDLFNLNQIFYSKRKLLTNYFTYREMTNDPHKNTYQIVEELRDNPLHIIEDETGSHIFEEMYSYLLEEISLLTNIEYGFVHTIFLSSRKSLELIKAYDAYLNDFDKQKFLSMMNLLKIKIYKGAYEIEQVLLKKGENNA